MPVSPKLSTLGCALLLLGCVAVSCSKSPAPTSLDGPLTLSGRTMGTYYRIKLADLPSPLRQDELESEIESILHEVNRQMSTYIPESELSRFNRHENDDWFSVSPEIALVVDEGLRINQLSEGAFDITIGPLVNLWGFGPKGGQDEVPNPDDIMDAMARVGSRRLQVRLSPPALKKNRSDLYVDLSGIAKGFAVDELARYLDSVGITGYMVDIGGELKTRGRKKDGSSWKIAVERPIVNGKEIQKVVPLVDLAMASSGDYRNYFEKNGERYSHEIDPATGWPIRHQLASVTVVDPSCMRADALATALMILGPEKGLKLAHRNNLAALFIIKGKDGFVERETVEFNSFVKSMERKIN